MVPAAGYDCIKAFSEMDLTEDLKKMDVPTHVKQELPAFFKA